jgi:hypothetical protein
MTKTNELEPLAAGDQFHILLDGLTLGAQTCVRGVSYTLTDEWIADCTDRNGHNFFAIVDDIESQESRFGQIVIGRGAWPEQESMFQDDQRKTQLAREVELELAMAIPDEEARNRRLFMVNAAFPQQANFWLTVDGVTSRG